MNKYILKRIGLMLITIVVIFIILFFLLQLVPGYPTAVKGDLQGAQSQEEFNQILSTYHSQNDPNIAIAFGKYVNGIFHGTWGTNFSDVNKSIPSSFFGPFGITITIMLPAFIIGSVIGIVMGFVAGYKKGEWSDTSIIGISTLAVSIPSFVLAIFMVLFGDKVGLPIDFTYAKDHGEFWLAIILPMLIIIITSFSSLVLYVRNEVIETLSNDYITVAKSQGLSGKTIFFSYVLKNSIMPIVSILVPGFIVTLGGTMIIEMFFNVNGTSTMITNAIKDKEIYLFMFATMFYTFIGLILSLVVDIIYAFIDPRIKIAEYRKSKRLHRMLINSYKRSRDRKKGDA